MTKIANVDQTVEPVDSLTPHPRNPNQGDVGSISESIEAHGFYGQVIAQQSSRTILAGEHRWRAAKAAGMAEIPVTWVDVDDDQALRIVLVDNRSAELASRDPESLVTLLQELFEEPLGLAGTGYDGAAMAELLASMAPPQIPTGLDEVTDRPTDAATRLGDLWELGPHRLVCGDATTPSAYTALLDGALVDAVVTDPPYNVAYEGKTADRLTIANDAMNDTDFGTFLVTALARAAEALIPGGPVYVFHAESNGSTFRSAFIGAGLALKQCVVWVKNTMVLGRQDYQWQHEPILYGWKPGAAHRWYGKRDKVTVVDDERDVDEMSHAELAEIVRDIRAEASVLREDKPTANKEHPTMKPPALIARLIANSSMPGDAILDPFGGSGSTLVAAETTGRVARLIELDPGYCDVICRRYENLTSTVPIRAGQPHSFLG